MKIFSRAEFMAKKFTTTLNIYGCLLFYELIAVPFHHHISISDKKDKHARFGQQSGHLSKVT